MFGYGVKGNPMLSFILLIVSAIGIFCANCTCLTYSDIIL